MADQLSIDVEALAAAGIAHQRPGVSPAELTRELAQRRFGHDLAEAAYHHARSA